MELDEKVKAQRQIIKNVIKDPILTNITETARSFLIKASMIIEFLEDEKSVGPMLAGFWKSAAGAIREENVPKLLNTGVKDVNIREIMTAYMYFQMEFSGRYFWKILLKWDDFFKFCKQNEQLSNIPERIGELYIETLIAFGIYDKGDTIDSDTFADKLKIMIETIAHDYKVSTKSTNSNKSNEQIILNSRQVYCSDWPCVRHIPTLSKSIPVHRSRLMMKKVREWSENSSRYINANNVWPKLSEREKGKINNAGTRMNNGKKLKWPTGYAGWKLKNDSYIRMANKLGKTSIAGPSGNTDMALQVTYYLGANESEMRKILLACVIWMGNPPDHSIHEMFIAAEYFTNKTKFDYNASSKNIRSELERLIAMNFGNKQPNNESYPEVVQSQ